MKVKYHKGIDSLEVLFESGVPSIGVESFHHAVTIFQNKKTKKINGYLIEGFSKNITLMMGELELNLAQKIAILMCYERAKKDLSQEEAAKLLHISMSTYRRVENGENFSLDVFENIVSRWPKFLTTPLIRVHEIFG